MIEELDSSGHTTASDARNTSPLASDPEASGGWSVGLWCNLP
jgi:hypothetical protein